MSYFETREDKMRNATNLAGQGLLVTRLLAKKRAGLCCSKCPFLLMHEFF